MFSLVMKVSGADFDELVVTLLVSMAASDELVPAPSITPPADSETWSSVLSTLEAIRKMPGSPSLGVVGVSTSIMTPPSDRDFRRTGECRLARGGRAVIHATRLRRKQCSRPVGRFSVKRVLRGDVDLERSHDVSVRGDGRGCGVLSLLFAWAPLAPATAAFTELTSGM